MSKPRKREGSPYYWYDFTVNGHRLRGSTETDCLETAKAIIAKLRSDAVSGKHFEKSKERISFDAACGRFLVEHAQYLKSYKTVEGHCKHILKYFGGTTDIATVANKEIHAYVSHRRTQVNAHGKRLVSDTTINRELETFRKMLNIARYKWEVTTAHINFREHMLREPEARTRWITPDEAETLIDKAADHLKAPLRFALLTGVRLSNITGLQWKDVNLKHREINFRIKSNIPGGKLLALPITDALAEVLEPLQTRAHYQHRRQVLDSRKEPMMYITTPEDYVFTYKGEQVRDSFKKAFR